MSNIIVGEVWKHGSVSGGDLLVLLALADAAGDTTRMSWESVNTISDKVNMTSRNVFRCLENLRQAGVIEDVPQADWPAAAHGYKSVVRRIREVDDWGVTPDKLSGVDSNTETDTSTPDNLSPLTPTSPNSNTYTSTSSQIEELRSSNDRTASRRVRSKARSKDDPDKDLDPASSLGLYEEPPGESQPSRGRRDRDPDSPVGLALNWSTRVSQTLWGCGLDSSNRYVLARKFKDWLGQGVTPEDIRQMTEVYITDPGVRNDRKVAWVDFLACRNLLLDRVRAGKREAAMESHRHDNSFWTGT